MNKRNSCTVGENLKDTTGHFPESINSWRFRFWRKNCWSAFLMAAPRSRSRSEVGVPFVQDATSERRRKTENKCHHWNVEHKERERIGPKSTIPLSLTHLHAHTLTHTHTHMNASKPSHQKSKYHTLTHTNTHPFTHTNTHMNVSTCTPMLTHSQTHTLTLVAHACPCTSMSLKLK